MRATHTKHALRLSIFAIVLVAVAVIGVVFWPVLRHQLALSFTRIPQPYSELYFTEPPMVTDTASGRFRGNVSFGVANHEGRPTTYDYLVTFRDGGRLIGQASGTLTAAEDQTATMEATVTGPRGSAAQLWDSAEVRLTGGANLHISYRYTTQ